MNQRDTSVDAATAAIGIAVKPEWLADIAANVLVLQRFNHVVDGFPLPDDIEPANVFTAIA